MPAVASVCFSISTCAYIQEYIEGKAYLATLHREGLPGSRLAIREHTDVVAIRAALCKLRDLLEDLRLGRMWLEDLRKEAIFNTRISSGMTG